MKFKKKQIEEIIDSDGELIGVKDTPENGSNLETGANNTTDYNAKIGHQPYRYDMLGRFGFTLLPFFEGKEDETNNELLDDLAKLMYDRYREMLEYYYKNPQDLKPDHRKRIENNSTFENDDEEGKKIDYKWANKIIDTIKPHLEKSFKQLDENLKENITEGAFVEGKMLEKKIDNEFATKKGDTDVVDSKLKKIVGLISKLDKDKQDKLKNLLENI